MREKQRKPDGGTMPLKQHLVELRKRLTFAALGIIVGAVLGFTLSGTVLEILRGPIAEIAKSRNSSLNYDSVSGAFDLRMQIAIYVGLIVSSPVWLYQIFAFLVPGLTKREKRYIFGFLFSAIPLFASGCVAGFLVFPHIVELMAGFAAQEDTSIFQAKYYFDFVMKLVLSVGIAFVLPVFIVLLNFMGILSARAIRKGWRIAILCIVIFCALATPAADVFSMFLLAIPMLFLYFLAAVIAHIHDRLAAKRSAKMLADDRNLLAV